MTSRTRIVVASKPKPQKSAPFSPALRAPTERKTAVVSPPPSAPVDQQALYDTADRVWRRVSGQE